MEAPKLPSIFKSRGPRQFNYRPFYFNPLREEREKRNRQILASMDTEEARSTEVFRSKLKERWEMSRGAKQQRNRSNLRLIVILMILIGLTYYLFL